MNFEQVPIFDEALVSSLVIVSENNKIKSDFLFAEFSKEPSPVLDFNIQIPLRNKTVKFDTVNDSSWSFNDDLTSTIVDKLYVNGKKIKDINSIDIKRGVTTGYDPAFIIDDEVSNNLSNPKIIKHLLKGAHIKKYFTLKSGLNLIFTRKGYNIEDDLKIKEHLFAFYDDLKPKINNENRGRKPGEYKWFEIQDSIAYYQNFEREKIIWSLTSDKWGFALDTEKNYLSSGGFMLVSDSLDLKYILAVLNSKLMNFLFNQIGVMTAGGAYTLKKATIDEFPILEIDIKSQQPLIEIVDKILSLKQANPQADTLALEQEIDVLVYQLYGLTDEEIMIVEKV